MDYGFASEAAEHGTVGRWLHKVFPVKRDEAVTVALLTLNVFVLLTCYYVLKVVREPLILLGGGAELKAYASAGQTLLLLAVVPAFGWLSSRVSRIRLLTTMQLVFIGCLVAFYVLAQAHGADRPGVLSVARHLQRAGASRTSGRSRTISTPRRAASGCSR